MNNTMGPSFKIVFLKKIKKYLRVPWTVHGTHQKSLDAGHWTRKTLSKHTLRKLLFDQCDSM